MTENRATRDILDLSVPSGDADYPADNMPKKSVERPRVDMAGVEAATQPEVSPQEGGYFLNKFLEQTEKNEAEAAAKEEAANTPVEAPADAETLQANIVEALREIYDPEIPVNIYEMGLIYSVDVASDFSVSVTMTLTTPHCPVAETMPGEVELKVSGVAGVNGVTVNLVWEPAWDMSRMSDEARLELGLL